MNRTYTFVFQPEPEGGYTVTCPALPGLVTHGDTLDEARAMAAEAMPHLRERLSTAKPTGFKAHLAAAPLEGIDLTRERDFE